MGSLVEARHYSQVNRSLDKGHLPDECQGQILLFWSKMPVCTDQEYNLCKTKMKKREGERGMRSERREEERREDSLGSGECTASLLCSLIPLGCMCMNVWYMCVCASRALREGEPDLPVAGILCVRAGRNLHTSLLRMGATMGRWPTCTPVPLSQ